MTELKLTEKEYVVIRIFTVALVLAAVFAAGVWWGRHHL